MTAIALTTRVLETSFLRPVTSFVSAVFAGIADARAMEARYDMLTRMSDSELAALGLTRNDVLRAVVKGVKGL